MKKILLLLSLILLQTLVYAETTQNPADTETVEVEKPKEAKNGEPSEAKKAIHVKYRACINSCKNDHNQCRIRTKGDERFCGNKQTTCLRECLAERKKELRKLLNK